EPGHRVEKETCIAQRKRAVQYPSVIQLHQRPKRPPEEETDLGGDVARRRRRAMEDLRRPTEGRPVSRPRLLQRPQDAGEVHRDQKKVERINVENIPSPIAGAAEVGSVEQVVRNGSDG